MEMFLGIDWGTHSSKWACFDAHARQYNGIIPVHSSNLGHEGDTLIFAPEEGALAKDFVVRGLKQELIRAPLASYFWDSERPDTGTTLGEAVVFSLCSLLADADIHISTSFGAKWIEDLEVGFSFPNWLVERQRPYRIAAKNFCEAVALAVGLFVRHRGANLPKPGVAFPIERWKNLVRDARNSMPHEKAQELSIDNMTKLSFAVADHGLKYAFVIESLAAGLPYLRATPDDDVRGLPGLAKLLVVDVGAGSTDVGYMLRAREKETGEEGIYFFPPAGSLPRAGNDLTENIMRYYAARGEPLTFGRAEARKLQQADWLGMPYVEVWKTSICQQVEQYIQGCTDRHWLHLPAPLNIVLTGGSGVVAGLRQGVERAVCEGLKKRQADISTASKVRLLGGHLALMNLSTEAEYARRAVCLGVTEPHKPRVRYMSKMEPPTRIIVDEPPQWV
jgi:hypothetical protein